MSSHYLINLFLNQKFAKQNFERVYYNLGIIDREFAKTKDFSNYISKNI